MSLEAMRNLSRKLARLYPSPQEAALIWRFAGGRPESEVEYGVSPLTMWTGLLRAAEVGALDPKRLAAVLLHLSVGPISDDIADLGWTE